MTKEEYVEALQEAVKTIDSLLERLDAVSSEISNLDYSVYVGNATSFKATCINNIKIYGKMSTQEFSRFNSRRLERELANRIKSLTLSCDAMTSDLAKNEWYQNKKLYGFDNSRDL